MRLPYELDQVRPTQIGLIVLQADETIEHDMRRLLPEDVEFLVSRVPSGEALTTDTIRAMEDHLTAAAALLPRGAHLSAAGYACTSGAAEIGAARVAAFVRAGVNAPHVSDPVTALIAALNHLDLKRIALVSPYVETVSRRLRDVLSEAGIAVTRFANFEEPSEENVVRISEASIVSAALEIGRAEDVDAVFLSCTNLRTLEAIPRIEARLGKPVLASNQVLAWHFCRLIGRAPDERQASMLLKSDLNI